VSKSEQEKENGGVIGEMKYHISELLPHSQKMFGVKPEVIHGAIYGVTQTHFTVSELRTLIKKFLNRKVK